jgi:hypothetical protein
MSNEVILIVTEGDQRKCTRGIPCSHLWYD